MNSRLTTATLHLLVGALGLVCFAAWSPMPALGAGPITYNFIPRSAGGWAVSGSFTTDGTIGLLTTANILSSSVAITNGNATYQLGIPTDGPNCHFNAWAEATATEVHIPLIGPGPAMDWCNPQSPATGIRIRAGGSDAGTIYFYAGGVMLAMGGGAGMPFAVAAPVPIYQTCLLYDPNKAVKSGSTLPIKLQICDTAGTNLSSATVSAHAVNLTMTSTSIHGDVQDAGNSNPDNDFRFDSTLGSTGGYIFNLKTTGLATGTYTLNFTVTGDSFTYTAPFQVK